jgi:hypothetical protein
MEDEALTKKIMAYRFRFAKSMVARAFRRAGGNWERLPTKHAKRRESDPKALPWVMQDHPNGVQFHSQG